LGNLIKVLRIVLRLSDEVVVQIYTYIWILFLKKMLKFCSPYKERKLKIP